MSTDHSYYMAISTAISAVEKLDVQTDVAVVNHLKSLLRIFCLNVILKQAAFLPLMRHLTSAHLRTAETVLNSEVAAISPQLLNLAEAPGFDDNTLASAIGCHDGNAIQRLYDQASASRLNGSDTIKGFNDYIQPILDGDFDKLRAKL